MEVPRDWAEPDGEKIELALVRLPVEDPEGSIVVNWGGPGAPGLTSIRGNGQAIQDATQGKFDIVSFDPRGLNESTPISCNEGNDLYFSSDPSTPEGLNQMFDAVQQRKDACLAKYGDYLGLIGTTQVVHDVDAVREALGQEKLDFLGHSYGTRIGSVYAAMYPDNVGRMVLDGALDPRSTMLSTAVGDAAAFDTSLRQWFERCAAKPDCAFGPDPAAGFDALYAQVRANPPVDPTSGGTVNVGTLNQVILAGLINYGGSTEIAEQAISQYLKDGDPSLLYLLGQAAAGNNADGTHGNSPEIFQFVDCLDWTDRPSQDEARAAVQRAAEASPRLGAFAIAFSYVNATACPVPAIGTPIPTDPDLPPILVINGVTDAETPYSWGQALSADLPNSVLLATQAFGHTVFYSSQCSADAAGAYFLEGTLPAAGSVCRAED